MNRGQLFNDVWKMMMGRPVLWIVALIGSGIGAVINLVLNSLSLDGSMAIAAGLLGTVVSLATTAFVTGAVVWMINAAAEDQTISLNDGLQAGLRKIVPLIFVELALMLPIWIIILFFSGSLLGVFGSALGQPNGIAPATVLPLLMGGFLGLGIAAIIVGIVTSLIQVGADRSVVLEDLAVSAALRRGWQLARKHFSDFVGIGIYMLIVSLGIAVLYACTIGAMLSSSISQLTADGGFSRISSLSGPAILSTLVNLAVGVFVSTLFSGVWTLAFREWTANDEIVAQPPVIEWR